jgi:hypothetical protein
VPDDVWLIHIEEGLNSVTFVDAARIERREANVRRAWAWVYYAPGGRDEKRVFLADYDCAERSFQGVRSTQYRTTGETYSVTAQADWTYPIPSSAADNVMGFVCMADAERPQQPYYVRLNAMHPPRTMDDAAAALFHVR